MKKNQERRLHRKNAKIVKEGGTPMQLNRPLKPDTTVRYRLLLKDKYQRVVLQRRCGHCGQMGHMSAYLSSFFLLLVTAMVQKQTGNVRVGRNSTAERDQLHPCRRALRQAHLPRGCLLWDSTEVLWLQHSVSPPRCRHHWRLVLRCQPWRMRAFRRLHRLQTQRLSSP